MLIKRFNSQYAFELDRTEEVQSVVKENTVPDWSKVSDVQFRPTQRETLEKLCEANRGRIIVPTAVGKSFLISQYARLMPKARIIVATYSNPVLLQLYKNIKEVLPSNQVGIHCSAKKENIHARVVCASIGTVKTYFPLDGEQNRDTFMVDELHELGSPSRLAVLEGVKHAKMFGLSANKSRPDKAEFRINGIFGPILAEMDYQEAVDHNLVTPIQVIWVPVKHPRDPTKAYESVVSKARYGIWRFLPRNLAIAKVAKMFDDDDQVLITTDKIEHALHVKQLLPDYTVVYSPQDITSLKMQKFHSMGLLKGIPPMTKDRLNMLKHMFEKNQLKKVIATDVWSRGVDFPELSVVIRADGKNSCIADTQWPGRASRKHDNKTVSLIFDFTDDYSPTLQRKAALRRKRYAEKAWHQITLNELQRMMFEE